MARASSAPGGTTVPAGQYALPRERTLVRPNHWRPSPAPSPSTPLGDAGCRPCCNLGCRHLLPGPWLYAAAARRGSTELAGPTAGPAGHPLGAAPGSTWRGTTGPWELMCNRRCLAPAAAAATRPQRAHGRQWCPDGRAAIIAGGCRSLARVQGRPCCAASWAAATARAPRVPWAAGRAGLTGGSWWWWCWARGRGARQAGWPSRRQQCRAAATRPVGSAFGGTGSQAPRHSPRLIATWPCHRLLAWRPSGRRRRPKPVGERCGSGCAPASAAAARPPQSPRIAAACCRVPLAGPPCSTGTAGRPRRGGCAADNSTTHIAAAHACLQAARPGLRPRACCAAHQWRQRRSACGPCSRARRLGRRPAVQQPVC